MPSSSSVDDEQAVDAVQRYYAAFNAALTSLDTKEMRTLFQPGCIVCEQDVAELDRMARAGERVTGGATSLANLSVTLRSENLLGIRATATSAAMTIKDRSGKVLLNESAVTATKNFTVSHVDGRWVVEGITK